MMTAMQMPANTMPMMGMGTVPMMNMPMMGGMPMMNMPMMGGMMPMMMPVMTCTMTCEMTKDGMVCTMAPMPGMTMEMMQECCTRMTTMMGMGMPMMMCCNGMPMMMGMPATK